MRKLGYIFYRFYSLMVDVGNGSNADYLAILLMTFIVCLNINSLFCLDYILLGNKVDLGESYKLKVILSLGTIFFIFYFLFIKNGKHLEIKKIYASESSKAKQKGRIFIVVYIVFSFVLLVSLFFLMMMKNRNLNP